MLGFLGNSEQVCLWCLYWWNIQLEVSALSFTFGPIFYLKKTWSKFLSIMLALLCPYFSLYTFVVAGGNQYSVIENPDHKNSSIENCYQDRFQTFVWALCGFFTRLLTLVYPEVITNI